MTNQNGSYFMACKSRKTVHLKGVSLSILNVKRILGGGVICYLLVYYKTPCTPEELSAVPESSFRPAGKIPASKVRHYTYPVIPHNAARPSRSGANTFPRPRTARQPDTKIYFARNRFVYGHKASIIATETRRTRRAVLLQNEVPSFRLLCTLYFYTEKTFINDRNLFRVDRNPFPVDRESFPIDRNPFPVDLKSFPIDRNPFRIDRNPFPIDRESFPIDRNPFPVDRNPFRIDRNPFPIDRESFPIDRKLFIPAFPMLSAQGIKARHNPAQRQRSGIDDCTPSRTRQRQYTPPSAGLEYTLINDYTIHWAVLCIAWLLQFDAGWRPAWITPCKPKAQPGVETALPLHELRSCSTATQLPECRLRIPRATPFTSFGVARGYPYWTPYGVGPECTKPCRVQYNDERLGMQNKQHITVSPVSRQGHHAGRNRPSLRRTVPAGRKVPPKTRIPSRTGRVRGMRRIFSANMLSLTGQVETRCIASLCGEQRHPAGSPGTMGTTGTVGTIPVTELAKNNCRHSQPSLRTVRNEAGSNPATAGMVTWTALLCLVPRNSSQPLAVTIGAGCFNSNHNHVNPLIPRIPVQTALTINR
jgi:hypothetical protein